MGVDEIRLAAAQAVLDTAVDRGDSERCHGYGG